MNSFWKMFGTLIWAVPLGLAVAVVSLLWRSDAKEAEIAERLRLECLEKSCDGDVVPPHNHLTHAVIKLYGQWYIGPVAYFTAVHPGTEFYWWQHKPIARGEPMAQELQTALKDGKGYDYVIEVFFTGRSRWSDPKAVEPWNGRGWEGRFQDMQARGFQVERERLNPNLERVRLTDQEGKPHHHEYYLAINERKPRGNGLPGVACDPPSTVPGATPRCTGGVYWQEDVYADFRFHAQHAADWPAIYEEIIRVLNLLQKITP